MKTFFCLLTLSLLNVAFAQHALNPAKVAHDASHRIGRLVDNGSVDEIYLKDMNSLQVRALPHTEHTQPAFSVLASAGTGDAQILLSFDMNGRYLRKEVAGSSSPQQNPWSINSSELLEAALHWVMESTVAEVGQFRELDTATLGQQVSGGSIQPVVTMTSTVTAQTLKVVLSFTGNILSFSIAN